MKLLTKVFNYIQDCYIEELYLREKQRGREKYIENVLALEVIYGSNEAFLSVVEANKVAKEYAAREKKYTFRYKTCSQFFEDILRFQLENEINEPDNAAGLYLSQINLCDLAASEVMKQYEVYYYMCAGVPVRMCI